MILFIRGNSTLKFLTAINLLPNLYMHNICYHYTYKIQKSNLLPFCEDFNTYNLKSTYFKKTSTKNAIN